MPKIPAANTTCRTIDTSQITHELLLPDLVSLHVAQTKTTGSRGIEMSTQTIISEVVDDYTLDMLLHSH